MKLPRLFKPEAYFLLLLLAGILTESLLYSQNTLALNGQWIASKKMMEMGVMGANEFLFTRSPLAGNALNLGSWYGAQEVVSKQSGRPEKIRFSFKVKENSYLDFFYGLEDGARAGLRFSRMPTAESAIFTSDADSRFTSMEKIPLPALRPGWHSAIVEFSSEGLSLSLDGEAPILIEAPGAGTGQVGFRAGLRGATIDDLDLQWREGGQLQDSFRNSRQQLLLFGAHLAILCLLFAFFAWWGGARRVTFALYCLLSPALAWHFFDYFYWSSLPFQPEMRELHTQQEVPQLWAERMRFRFFRAWARQAGSYRAPAALVEADGYPGRGIYKGPVVCDGKKNPCQKFAGSDFEEWMKKKKACKRIVFLGTSQTIGSGARKLSETFFARTHRLLAEAWPQGCVESVNIAISGFTLKDFRRKYPRSFYAKLKPDLIVANFSNNGLPETFTGNLKDLAETGRDLGARVLFVQEANSTEMAPSQGLRKKHEIMKDVGEREQVPVLPLHDFLARMDARAGEPLWWDVVHLSSYGQKLVADWLAPQIMHALGPHGIEHRHERFGPVGDAHRR